MGTTERAKNKKIIRGVIQPNWIISTKANRLGFDVPGNEKPGTLVKPWHFWVYIRGIGFTVTILLQGRVCDLLFLLKFSWKSQSCLAEGRVRVVFFRDAFQMNDWKVGNVVVENVCISHAGRRSAINRMFSSVLHIVVSQASTLWWWASWLVQWLTPGVHTHEMRPQRYSR